MSSAVPPASDPAIQESCEQALNALGVSVSTVVGITLLAIFYGFEIFLLGICIRGLWKNTSRSRSNYLLLGNLLLIQCLNTIWLATSVKVFLVDYIAEGALLAIGACLGNGSSDLSHTITVPGLGRNYVLSDASTVIVTVRSSSFALGNMFADALLFWRSYVIWQPVLSTFTKVLFVIPGLLVFAPAILTIYAEATSDPGNKFFISSVTTSLFLNIVLASLITLRLSLYRRRIQRTFGADHGRPYRMIALIVVESASLYVVFSFILLMTVVVGNKTTEIWLYLNAPIQNIANMLIVHRITNGTAWRADTHPTTSISMVSMERDQPGALMRNGGASSDKNIRASTVPSPPARVPPHNISFSAVDDSADAVDISIDKVPLDGEV
ncbi:hypothetical protein K474DRAFT_1664559 [Panus rudis PR-1116 ss-1]|nr:hypothetical protein K474DRAFT_1664559 [Panus rudis PR-1116 ss-1]